MSHIAFLLAESCFLVVGRRGGGGGVGWRCLTIDARGHGRSIGGLQVELI